MLNSSRKGNHWISKGEVGVGGLIVDVLDRRRRCLSAKWGADEPEQFLRFLLFIRLTCLMVFGGRRYIMWQTVCGCRVKPPSHFWVQSQYSPPKHVKSRTPICVMLRYMAPPKIGGIQVKSVWRRGFVCPVKIIHKNEVEALPLNCEGVFFFFAFVGITRHPGITQEPHVMGFLYYSAVKTESEVPIQVNMKKEKNKYIYICCCLGLDSFAKVIL